MRNAQRGIRRGAVVATIKEEGVVFQALGGEVAAKLADGAVHGGDLGIPLAQHFPLRPLHLPAGFIGGQTNFFGILGGKVVIQGEVRRQAAVGLVRGAKPDDGEEGLLLLADFVDELDGFSDKNLRALPLEDLGRAAVAGEGGVELKKVVVREPLVEAHGTGAGGGAGLDRADMPFAKMTALITRLAEDLSAGDFLRTKGPAGSEGAHAVRVPASQEAGPGGGAARMRGVETVQPQAGGGHLVEDRSTDVRMAVVTRLLPAVVIAHHQDDIGRCGRSGRRRTSKQRESKRKSQEGQVKFHRSKKGSDLLCRYFWVAAAGPLP